MRFYFSDDFIETRVGKLVSVSFHVFESVLVCIDDFENMAVEKYASADIQVFSVVVSGFDLVRELVRFFDPGTFEEFAANDTRVSLWGFENSDCVVREKKRR